MTIPMSAQDVLNREFLELRARVLDLAAALDRIDRASGDVSLDARMGQLRDAMAVLLESGPDRAERVQLIFSLPYDAHWKERFFS
jgi:hypothetical protein